MSHQDNTRILYTYIALSHLVQLICTRQYTYIVYIVYVYCHVTSCTVRGTVAYIVPRCIHYTIYALSPLNVWIVRNVEDKTWSVNLSLSLSLSLSTSMLSPSLPKGRVPVMQWKIRMPMAHTSDCGPTYMYVYTDILYHYIYVCVYTNTLYHYTCMCVQQYIIPYTNAFLCVCICIQIYICTNIYPMYTNIYVQTYVLSNPETLFNTFYRTREHIL